MVKNYEKLMSDDQKPMRGVMQTLIALGRELARRPGEFDGMSAVHFLRAAIREVEVPEGYFGYGPDEADKFNFAIRLWADAEYVEPAAPAAVMTEAEIVQHFHAVEDAVRDLTAAVREQHPTPDMRDDAEDIAQAFASPIDMPRDGAAVTEGMALFDRELFKKLLEFAAHELDMCQQHGVRPRGAGTELVKLIEPYPGAVFSTRLRNAVAGMRLTSFTEAAKVIDDYVTPAPEAITEDQALLMLQDWKTRFPAVAKMFVEPATDKRLSRNDRIYDENGKHVGYVFDQKAWASKYLRSTDGQTEFVVSEPFDPVNSGHRGTWERWLNYCMLPYGLERLTYFSTEEQATTIVKAYREKFPAIAKLWQDGIIAASTRESYCRGLKDAKSICDNFVKWCKGLGQTESGNAKGWRHAVESVTLSIQARLDNLREGHITPDAPTPEVFFEAREAPDVQTAVGPEAIDDGVTVRAVLDEMKRRWPSRAPDVQTAVGPEAIDEVAAGAHAGEMLAFNAGPDPMERVADEMTRPSVIHHAELSFLGKSEAERWQASIKLSGLASGFYAPAGATPEEAMRNFDKAWKGA